MRSRIAPSNASRTIALPALLLSFSCAATGALIVAEDGDTSGWARPASSEQRAHARAQREARERALNEQESAPVASAERGTDPELASTDLEVAEVDAGTAIADAGVQDPDVEATADPVIAPVVPDAGEAPVDIAVICSSLCERAIECALERLEEGGVDDGPFLERLKERVRGSVERCKEKCAEQAEEDADDDEKVAAVRACMAKDSCDDFMECMEDVMAE